MVKKLKAIMVNINEIEESNNLKWTSLHRAVYSASIEWVNWLLANGAAIVQDTDGHYPHQISCYYHKYTNSGDHVQDKLRDYEIAKRLVKEYFDKQQATTQQTTHVKKININERETDQPHSTLLHRAALKADYGFANYLINKGATIAKDSNQHYPHQAQCFFHDSSHQKDYKAIQKEIEDKLKEQNQPTQQCIIS